MSALSPPTPRRPKAKVIVFGILFWYPLAGVTFQFLHYLIGLRRLGYDVYYVEDSSRYLYDPTIHDLTGDASNNIAAIAPILEKHGFADRWAFRWNCEGGRCYGMQESELLQVYRDADAFLNVTGDQELSEAHRKISKRIYVESDPFSSQVKYCAGERKWVELLSGHNVHFTFGENIGQPDCGIPHTPFDWMPTRQPVVTDLWKHKRQAGEAFNTITTWSNKGKHVQHAGETYYWTKDREFEKVLDLPRRTRVPFELATQVPDDVRSRLTGHGWRLSDAIAVSGAAGAYQDYIQCARGEFTVARDQYVRPRTGWFSDRTACYLAAGRPVITQETGFSKFLPSGRGLFGWENIDDVLHAVENIESDYAGHCRAARDVALEYFEAEKVLASLMARSGL